MVLHQGGICIGGAGELPLTGSGKWKGEGKGKGRVGETTCLTFPPLASASNTILPSTGGTRFSDTRYSDTGVLRYTSTSDILSAAWYGWQGHGTVINFFPLLARNPENLEAP